MIISAPKLHLDNGSVIASANFESKTHKDALWFKLDVAYKDHVVTERGDAFLVGLLVYAMSRGEDVRLECPISEKLYYNLSNYLIPAISLANPAFRRVEILPSKLEGDSVNVGGGVGTGFSGGVDSFCTIYEHLASPECPPNYRLTHLTFFNVGSHGDFGGDSARALFNERYNILKAFPAECGMDLLVVDSNISDILRWNYEETFTLRSMAPVLLLQKLFRTYYFSAGYRIDDFKLAAYDMALYDALNVPMLSTESVTMYSAGCQHTRVEKTSIIADYEPTWRYLNVCSCRGGNCSSCFKCLRTLYTLDLLGKLQNYDKVFDLAEYRRFKERYIGQVLANKKDYFYKDIYAKMVSQNIDIPIFARLATCKYRSDAALRRLKGICG